MPDPLSDLSAGGQAAPAAPQPPAPPAPPAPPPAAVIVTSGTRSEREIELQRQVEERDLKLRDRETECSELQDVNRSLRDALKPAPAPRKKRGIMAEFLGLKE